MSEEEIKRSREELHRKNSQPSVKGFFLTIGWYLGLAFIAFLILGFLTDGYGTGDDGNVPGIECYDYQQANGDWANSCDQ
jgi:hypothetical protein